MQIHDKRLETLLNSEAFRAAEREADQKRIEAHEVAADALLAHKASADLMKAATEAIEKARGELVPIAAKHEQARQKLAAAEATAGRIAWQREHESARLMAELRMHLPDIVARTEAAMPWIEADIRAAYADKSYYANRRWVYADNGAEMRAALAEAETFRNAVAILYFEPMPADAIIRQLSAAAGPLIEAAKTAGALVAHHLPAELRGPGLVEMPEREKMAFAFPS